MKKIVATPAGEPKLKFIKYVGWVMSAYLLVICVSQFVQAAQFADSVFDYCTKGQIGVLAFLTIFAVPFLAGLKISKLMRFVSLGFGWMIAALFFMMAVMPDVAQSGIMGNLAFYSYTVLMFIVTWGYWPLRNQKKPAKKAKKTTKRKR